MDRSEGSDRSMRSRAGSPDPTTPPHGTLAAERETGEGEEEGEARGRREEAEETSNPPGRLARAGTRRNRSTARPGVKPRERSGGRREASPRLRGSPRPRTEAAPRRRGTGGQTDRPDRQDGRQGGRRGGQADKGRAGTGDRQDRQTPQTADCAKHASERQNPTAAMANATNTLAHAPEGARRAWNPTPGRRGGTKKQK